MSKATQRQFYITVDGIDHPFATKTGGNVTSATSKVWDGGTLRPDVLTAPAEAENLIISRPYDPDRDNDVVNSLRSQVGTFITTVTVQPTDRNLIKTGDPVVYANAQLVRVGEPEADAASGAAARFELEFAIGDYT